MPSVLHSMRKALSEAPGGFCSGAEGPHDVIIRWGDTIREQFVNNNLRLHNLAADTGSAQTVKAIESLGNTVGALQTEVATLSRHLSDTNVREMQELVWPAPFLT
jgi:hypothetical protein